MVFTAVFVTIMIFAVGFPLAKSRLTKERALLMPVSDATPAPALTGTEIDVAPAVQLNTEGVDAPIPELGTADPGETATPSLPEPSAEGPSEDKGT
jgi:hypothetical protein